MGLDNKYRGDKKHLETQRIEKKKIKDRRKDKRHQKKSVRGGETAETPSVYTHPPVWFLFG